MPKKKNLQPLPEAYQEIKKVIILKNGQAMDIDEWTNIPYKGHSITEDAEFEIIEPKRIENGQAANNTEECS